MKIEFSDWQIIKHSVVHQKYDIPSENGLAELGMDDATRVARKELAQNGS